jgi:N utilization substance protein A
VVIEGVAREAGSRTKIGVSSRDRDVDPVGACVGIKGSRVQAVVQELRGEKIDIITYDPDPARYVVNALAPAEVSRVIVDEGNHSMEVVVADEVLSLAIGRRGQNVRLASKLTGWKIDVKPESQYNESLKTGYRSLLEVVGVSDGSADTLFQAGYTSAEMLAEAEAESLIRLPGMDEQRVKGLIALAKEYLAQRAEKKLPNASQAASEPSPDEDLDADAAN